MKIGAMVPQGWRMDLNGIKPEKQWDAILEASTKIEQPLTANNKNKEIKEENFIQ